MSDGTIASKLPKDVHLDKVTAGNILDHLRAYSAMLAEQAPSIGITVLGTMKDVMDDTKALADALTVTILRSGS